MRSKFTLLLLALNLALFGYLLYSERPWSATQKIDENRRRVLGPEAADLSALEIAAYAESSAGFQPVPAPNAPSSTPSSAPAPQATRQSTTDNTSAAPAATATSDPSASTAPAPLRTVRLRRETRDGAWLLATPLDWPANDFAVRRILNELQFLENETSFLVSDLAASGQTLADYGLDRPRIIVTATPTPQATSQSMIDNGSDASSAASPSFTFKIGATAAVGGRLYVLSPDEKRVHVLAPKTSENLLSALTLDLDQLRSDQLFTIPVFEARALTLQTASTASARTRLRRDQTRWLFEAPITARAAKTPVELAINDLNSLRVARFIPPDSAPPPETTGLDAPRLRVTLEGNARRETLHLGAPVTRAPGATPSPAATPSAPAAPADTIELHARLDWRSSPASGARPVLFTVQVPTKLLESLEEAQTALRDRRVLDLDPARVTALALSAPGFPELRIQKLDTDSAWQIAAPATATPLRADNRLVERLLQRLQLLEAVPPRPDASPFVSDAPSRTELENLGFNRPERSVSLQLAAPAGASSAASTLVLELAQPDAAHPALYARVAGQPFIYSVPLETLEQIPVAPRFYRDRALLRLPEATRVARLLVRRADAPAEAPPLLDYSPSATPAPAPVATLLAALRELRAGSIVREDFPATTLVDGVEKPWAYVLEATLDPAPASGPLVLHLAERAGGSVQLAGSRELGLVFTLEQPVVDALWQLLYREPKP